MDLAPVVRGRHKPVTRIVSKDPQAKEGIPRRKTDQDVTGWRQPNRLLFIRLRSRKEAVTKLIAHTRLIAVATSELPANLFGIRTLCRLDERIALKATDEISKQAMRMRYGALC
jgi:hypothetical protein